MNIPTSINHAIEMWDKGWTIWTIEMGGLGPGYEQAIHIAVMELLRQAKGRLPGDDDDWDTEVLNRIDPLIGGITGAQAGAIKNLAFQYLTKPWQTVLDSVPQDRHIQISAYWPIVPPSSRAIIERTRMAIATYRDAVQSMKGATPHGKAPRRQAPQRVRARAAKRVPRRKKK